MSPEDRAKLGKGCVTASEAQTKWRRGEERRMHDVVEAWLRRREIPFVHARMDKASTIAKGWPDFTVVYRGRALCLELKAQGGKPTAEQVETLAILEKTGTPCKIAYSEADALEWLRERIEAIGTSAEAIDSRAGCV